MRWPQAEKEKKKNQRCLTQLQDWETESEYQTRRRLVTVRERRVKTQISERGAESAGERLSTHTYTCSESLQPAILSLALPPVLTDAKKSDLPTLGSCVWQPITGERTPSGVTSSPHIPNICLSDRRGRQVSGRDKPAGQLSLLLSNVRIAIINHLFWVIITFLQKKKMVQKLLRKKNTWRWTMNYHYY